MILLLLKSLTFWQIKTRKKSNRRKVWKNRENYFETKKKKKKNFFSVRSWWWPYSPLALSEIECSASMIDFMKFRHLFKIRIKSSFFRKRGAGYHIEYVHLKSHKQLTILAFKFKFSSLTSKTVVKDRKKPDSFGVFVV